MLQMPPSHHSLYRKPKATSITLLHIHTPLESVNIREELLILEKMNACLGIYLKTHKKFSTTILTKHRDIKLLPHFHSLVLDSYHSFHSCSAILHRFFWLSSHEKMATPWIKGNSISHLSSQFQKNWEVWH